MAGPYVDPKSAQQLQDSSQMNGFDAAKFASEIARRQSSMQNPETSAPMMDDHSIKPGPMNEHTQNMQEAALAAKKKYMVDNSVDEDGQPVR